MSETAIVAYIMGGFAIFVGILFLIGMVVIYRITKFRVKHDPYYKGLLKQGERMARAEMQKYKDRHNS